MIFMNKAFDEGVPKEGAGEDTDSGITTIKDGVRLNNHRFSTLV